MSAIRGRVQVTWNPPLSTGGGVTGYAITRTGGRHDIAVQTAGTPDGLGNLSWLDTTAVTGTTYTYTITAVSAGGAGAAVSQTVIVPRAELVVIGDHGVYGLSDEGSTVPIVTDANADFSSPAVSPDGRLLAFARGASASSQHDLYVLPLDGGDARRVTTSSSNEIEPAWSSDGHTLAYTSISGSTSSIWTVPAAGGRTVKLADSASHPTWLGTDGTVVAVDNSVANGRLIVLQHGARGVIPGTTGAVQPAASPDGQWLAYSLWHSDIGEHSLVIIPTHDGDGVELQSPVMDFQHPSWLYDGSGLLFDTRESGGVSQPSLTAFPAAIGSADVQYLNGLGGYSNPIYASTAPTPARAQKWGSQANALRPKGSFGAVHTKVAPRHW